MNHPGLLSGLDSLARAFPDLQAKVGMDADTCVWATRIFTLAAYEAGVVVRPQLFRVDCFSPAWMQRSREDPAWTETMNPTDADRLKAKGVKVVTIGDPRHDELAASGARKGLNGHLAVIVENDILLDLTLHQAARPAVNMPLRPWARPYPGSQQRAFGFDTDEGAYVRYEHLDGNPWRDAPDWKLPGRGDPEVVALIDALGQLSARLR